MMHGGKKTSTQKPKNFKKGLGQIIKYLNKFYLPIIIALIFAIAATVLDVLAPEKIRELTAQFAFLIKIPGLDPIIQDKLSSEAMAKILSLTIVLVVFYGLATIFNIIQNYVMSVVTEKTSHRLRQEINDKTNKVPLKYFDNTSYGDIISRVTNDVDTISQTLNQSVAQFLKAIVMLIGSVIMMFVTSPLLALTAIGSSLLGFVLIGIIMSRSQKYFMRQQAELGSLNGFIEEAYSNHNVIKTYNAENEFKTKFKTINKKLHDSAWKSQFFSGIMMPLMSFVGNLGYVMVLVIGSVLQHQGKITIDIILVFMIYVRLFTQPLTQLAQVGTSLQRTAAASERVFDFLNAEELENESEKTTLIKNTKGLVEFENVNFSYISDKPVINNFTAYANGGSKVAIVGPTGAGKTTIVNLLMRFYELNSGKIMIDGVDISQVKRENVHEQFSMVLQDTWLFEGTIYENIVYSMKDVDREKVIEACRKTGLDHFIKTLPQGYETVLTEKTSLSEGQKQQLTIARAMIKDAPLLILDEATSSVDTRTERIIQEAMDELMQGRTSFIIAHRLSTIKNADLILVMNEGDIVEKGNHDSLIKLDGFYAKLYNSQFEL